MQLDCSHGHIEEGKDVLVAASRDTILGEHWEKCFETKSGLAAELILRGEIPSLGIIVQNS